MSKAKAPQKEHLKRLFDENWGEVGDPTPVEVPLNFRPPPTIQEQIKRFVRTELSRQAAEKGHETFDEANDFGQDDEDDGLPRSAHEFTELEEERLNEALKFGEQERVKHERSAKENAAGAKEKRATDSGVKPAKDEGAAAREDSGNGKNPEDD